MTEGRKSLLGLDLSLEEIDGLLSTAELNAGVRNMLKDKKELSLKQIKQEALNSESPRDAIKAILKIPNKEELGEEIVDLGRISVRILIARATERLSIYKVELLGQVLMRMYPDGNGLGDEPWKILFLENAKKSFPGDTEKILEEVETAGISKEDYIDEVLRHTLLTVLHGTSETVLANAIYRHKNFLSDIKNFYGVSNLDWEEEQKLLKAGDILLKGLSGEMFGSTYLRRAIEVYRWLRCNRVIEIGEDRKEAIEIFQGYELGKISKRAKDRKIRRIAKSLKII